VNARSPCPRSVTLAVFEHGAALVERIRTGRRPKATSLRIGVEQI
jgi:hypothetical protein